MSTTTNARFEVAHHGPAMQDHHVHGDAHRGRQAVHHHADAVSDQQDVARVVQQGGHRRRVGGEADKRRRALGGGDVAHGLAGRLGLGGHRDASFWLGAA